MNKLLSPLFLKMGMPAVALFLMCSLASAQSQSDWNGLFNLMKRYQTTQQSGKWNDALPHAERIHDYVLQRFPRRLHFYAYEQLAEIKYLQGQHEQSRKLYQQMLDSLREFKPRNSQERAHTNLRGNAYRGIAVTLMSQGRPEEAVPYYQQAIRWWDQSTHQYAPASSAQNRTDLATTYRDMGQFGKAIELYRAAVPILEREIRKGVSVAHCKTILAIALRYWGSVYKRMGRFDLAEPKVRRAISTIVGVHGWNHPHTGEILTEMGNIIEAQGRWDEAESYYRASLKSFEASVGKRHPRALDPRGEIARVLRRQERYEEAAAEFRRLIDLRTEIFGAEHITTANTIKNLSATLSLQGRYDEAEPLLLRSIEIHKEAENIALLASLKNLQGHRTEALELANRVLAIHQTKPVSLRLLRDVYFIRALAYWALKRQDEAIAEARKALQLAETQRGYAAGAERERATLYSGLSFDFEVMIEWQAELGNVAELFAAIEQLKARSFLDELRAKNVDILAGLSESERKRLNDRSDELRRRLSEAERNFDALPQPGNKPSAAEKAKRKEAAKAIFAARDALYQHLTDVRASSPAYRQLITSRAKTATIDDVQQRLGEDEVVLAYHVGESYDANHKLCYVVTIGSDFAEFQTLDVDGSSAKALGIPAGQLTGKHLSQVLLSQSTGIMPMLSSHDDQKDIQTKLAALWNILIPEKVRTDLVGDKYKLLTIIPSGPLALLPFETLVVSDDAEPAYLLDVGPPVAYAPSASVLLNLGQRKRKERFTKEPVLTIGNPQYSSGTSSTSSVDRQVGAIRSKDRFRLSLTPLPFSGQEATWLKSHFEKREMPCVKLTGASATESQVRRLITGREIVHFACHGMADQNYGNFFGSLALAPGRRSDPKDDGFLSMSEIYELDMDGCELAILSACQTNYGPQQKGEGVWALSRGFLVAGARRVVASNWVVDDKAGAYLISYFGDYLSRAGKDASARDYANALQKAKRLIRKNENWSDPFYWSSLVLVGPN